MNVAGEIYGDDASSCVACACGRSGTKHKLTGGGEDWRWVGQGVPDILSFGDELSPQNVQVRWREPAKTAQQSNIPVTVERQLYRLIPGEEEMSFTLLPVTSNEIDSDALYLDEITLTQRAGCRSALRSGGSTAPARG